MATTTCIVDDDGPHHFTHSLCEGVGQSLLLVCTNIEIVFVVLTYKVVVFVLGMKNQTNRYTITSPLSLVIQ